jgi:cytochrome c-type biogenesis protein CcmH/NrfG
LIWLIVVAVVFVAGGAWFVSRSMAVRAVVAAAGVAAVAGYWLLGRPAMQDNPLGQRLSEIEKLSSEQLNGAQLMALAQKRAQEKPNDPGPHIAMGMLMEMAGQPNEAMMAYEAALRRSPEEVEVISRLADLRFKMTGDVDAATSALYHEWFKQRPDELRVGYLAGIGDWKAGRREEAEKIWADVEARTPEGDPRRGMYKALREMFGVDPPSPGQPQTPSPAPQPG